MHIGIVEIKDNTEIGACCTIDRGMFGKTTIGKNVIMDNQVHIGHNVSIGDNTAFAAGVGVGGSTTIGKSVKVGGQAGFADHITVGDGATIGAQAGVTKDVPVKAFWTGNPAREIKEKRREQAILRKLSKKD